MAGSSNGEGIIVEPGKQRSFWTSNVEHTLRIMREELGGTTHITFRILKVPEYLRQPTAAFSPGEWRFGLHNRDENQTDISESEATKRAVVVLFGLDEQSKWMSFCNAVVPDPKAMLKCYGLHKEVNDLLEDEVKQVLTIDALFLAVRIEIYNLMNNQRLYTEERRLKSPQMFCNFEYTFRRCYYLVNLDLCKIENQIPFDLIKRAIKHVQMVEHVPDSYLKDWMKTVVQIGMQEFMNISAIFYEGANANEMLLGSDHILDAAYKVVCGVNGLKRTGDYSQKDYIHVPSATRLKESGIKIEGVVGPLCGMSYDTKNKRLSLPKMRIHDTTVSLVQNMARYAENHEDKKCMFHDYVFLMLDLIQTPSDLKHLTKCGVIHNGCGIRAVDMWGALDHGLVLIRSSAEHNRMKVDITNRCKLRRHRFWSEYKRLFLSRPWLTLSTIVVVLVTVATLIQTYIAIISSNHMKPQFTP